MPSLGEKTYREIYGQTRSFAALLDTLPDITATLTQVFSTKYDQLIFTGCGTSFYLAQTAAHVFNLYNSTPAWAVCCSEMYDTPSAYIKGARTLVLPITRKSYTTEVRRAMDRVRAMAGVTSLSITCDGDSALYNDHVVLCPETPEDSVIMTRSFTSMVLMAEIISLFAAGRHQDIQGLKSLPALSEAAIPAMDQLAARIVSEKPNLNLFITLGQGMMYGIANESMNKMKEMSLSNSEAYYSLEYRHGPMSLLDENTLIMLFTLPETRDADTLLLRELEGYGGVSVAMGPHPEAVGGAYTLPLGTEALTCAVLGSIFGQMIGYHLAQKKGLNPDTPRHLSQAIVLKS